MPLKLKRLLVIYGLAALAALAGFSWAAEKQLGALRLMADAGSARAFEEAVTAVEDLSLTLRKLGFAGDSALGKRLCAQALADAQAAETAISILPFSTQELEKLSGFLGRAGDYAGSLCALTDETLGADDRGHLHDLGAAAADFAARLRELQGELHAGGVRMDSREKRPQNVGGEDGQMLSALLLDYEHDFAAPEAFAYEGKFSPAEASAPGTLTEAEARELAAKAAGVEARELREEYNYEGPDGRRCYSAGDLLLGVSSRGLEFMSRPRLIESAALSEDEARERAERFLERLGYENLELYAGETGGGAASFRFAPTQDGVPRPDDALTLSVALDDGTVCAFDATRFRADAPEVSWNTDEEAARATLPEGIEAQAARRVIRRSPGGSSVPCWELSCADGEGRQARVYVDARSGRPWLIEL